jgi:L-lactate utilization protein LutB
MDNERMQAAIKELEETMTVMAHLQARQAEMLKDHAEWLHTHDKAIAETREAGRALDERIANLVSAIGEFIARQK